MQFRLGCAVWSYKDWVGEFYPAGSRAQDFLRLYSQRLTAVEGNTTFYAIPDRPTLERWVEQTPPDFEFCLKLPRSITHEGALVAQIPSALQFLEHMQILGSRLGPLFAQLPPTYSPQAFEDLRQFLTAWPQAQTPLAIEVRHPDWFQEPHARNLGALLESLGLGRVLLDTRPIYTCEGDPQIRSRRRKPQLPLQIQVTTDFSLVRFISHPDRPWNEPFLSEWVTQVGTWLTQGIRVYFFVHCPEEERSPHTARQFQHQLEQAWPEVPSLPWDSLQEPELQQLSLF